MMNESKDSDPLFQTDPSQTNWSFKCRGVLPGTLLLAAVLAIAVTTVSNRPLRPVVPSQPVSLQQGGAGFALKQSGIGCSNGGEIEIDAAKVSGLGACAAQCRARVLKGCKQFLFFNRDIAADPYADGDRNCHLLKAGCQETPLAAWELYDDFTNPSDFDGTVDTHWPGPWPRGSPCDSGDFSGCDITGVQDVVDKLKKEPLAREGFEAAFDAIADGAGDRCEETAGKRLFAVGRLGDGGFTARMNTFALEALFAMWAGLPMSLCTRDGMRDSWGVFFKDPGFAQCSGCHGEVGEFLRTGPGADLQYALGIEAGSCASNVVGPTISVATKRYVYSRLFKFRPELLEKHESLMSSLGLDGVPYIGVHMRRGDKTAELQLIGEPQTTAQEFAAEIRKQCDLVNGGVEIIDSMNATAAQSPCHVFLASDDSSSIAELQSELPDMKIVQQDRLSDDVYAVRNRDDESEDTKTQSESSFVMDLLMLVHSSSFVGTATSSVGRFVFFMRAGDKPSVSLDENFTERNC